RTDRCSHGRAFADDTGVAAFVRIAADRAFLPVELLIAAGVDISEAGAEIAGDSVRKSQRIEANVQLAFAFDAARALDVSDCSGDEAAGRNDDVRVDYDRRNGFRVDSISGYRMFRA